MTGWWSDNERYETLARHVRLAPGGSTLAVEVVRWTKFPFYTAPMLIVKPAEPGAHEWPDVGRVAASGWRFYVGRYDHSRFVTDAGDFAGAGAIIAGMLSRFYAAAIPAWRTARLDRDRMRHMDYFLPHGMLRANRDDEEDPDAITEAVCSLPLPTIRDCYGSVFPGMNVAMLLFCHKNK